MYLHRIALLQRPKAMPQKRRKQRKTPLKRLILLARKQQIVRDSLNFIIQKATVALFGAELFKSKVENVSLSAFALVCFDLRIAVEFVSVFIRNLFVWISTFCRNRKRSVAKLRNCNCFRVFKSLSSLIPKYLSPKRQLLPVRSSL
jgi:hypothetical protein